MSGEIGLTVRAIDGKVRLTVGETKCEFSDLDQARKFAGRIYEEIDDAEKQRPIEASKVGESNGDAS